MDNEDDSDIDDLDSTLSNTEWLSLTFENLDAHALLQDEMDMNQYRTGAKHNNDVYKTASASMNQDYQLTFQHAYAPLAVASINGHILDCNPMFLAILGYHHHEMLQLNVFHLVQDAYLHHSFNLISSLLFMTHVGQQWNRVTVPSKSKDGHSAGLMLIDVVRDEILRPKFFALHLSPVPYSTFYQHGN